MPWWSLLIIFVVKLSEAAKLFWIIVQAFLVEESMALPLNVWWYSPMLPQPSAIIVWRRFSIRFDDKISSLMPLDRHGVNRMKTSKTLRTSRMVHRCRAMAMITRTMPLVRPSTGIIIELHANHCRNSNRRVSEWLDKSSTRQKALCSPFGTWSNSNNKKLC